MSRAIDETLVARLRRHWDEGWNGADLDTIMAPFADDVVFSSPFVVRATGDPERSTIAGAAALRAYVDGALRRRPGIRYRLDATHVGTETVVLVYTCRFPEGGTMPGSDLMRVGDDGQVVEWRCHYPLDRVPSVRAARTDDRASGRSSRRPPRPSDPSHTGRRR